MKILIIFIFATFLCSLGNAQPTSPAFMGKKFLLNANISGSWLITMQNRKEHPPLLSISGEYVISKRETIGFLLKSKRHMGSINESMSQTRLDADYQFRSTYIGLKYSLYRRRYNPPFGLYYSISLLMNHLHSKNFLEDQMQVLETHYQTTNLANNLKKTDFRFLSVIKPGYRFLLKNNLSVDLSIDLEIPLSKRPNFQEFTNASLYKFKEEYFRAKVRDFNRNPYLFFTTGIGYSF